MKSGHGVKKKRQIEEKTTDLLPSSLDFDFFGNTRTSQVSL
jgi:hypothetical protein